MFRFLTRTTDVRSELTKLRAAALKAPAPIAKAQAHWDQLKAEHDGVVSEIEKKNGALRPIMDDPAKHDEADRLREKLAKLYSRLEDLRVEIQQAAQGISAAQQEASAIVGRYNAALDRYSRTHRDIAAEYYALNRADHEAQNAERMERELAVCPPWEPAEGAKTKRIELLTGMASSVGGARNPGDVIDVEASEAAKFVAAGYAIEVDASTPLGSKQDYFAMLRRQGKLPQEVGNAG